MHVVIIGCGKIGSSIARQLSNEGYDVSIIDKDREKLEILGSGFNGQRIKGVEFDNDVLLEAGVDKADVFLAMTSDDNINLTATQIARKIFNVPKIIARICDPNRTFMYEQLKIETICPTQSGVNIIKNKIFNRDLKVLSYLGKDIEIIEVCISKNKLKTINEIEEKCYCIVSVLDRQGEVLIPDKNTNVNIGDKIICTLNIKNKEKLMHVLGR